MKMEQYLVWSRVDRELIERKQSESISEWRKAKKLKISWQKCVVIDTSKQTLKHKQQSKQDNWISRNLDGRWGESR